MPFWTHRAMKRLSMLAVWAGVLLLATVATHLAMFVGQRMFLTIVDPAAPRNSVLAALFYEHLVKWVAHPAAAFTCGVVVGTLGLPFGGSAVAVIGGLTPLWLSWLRAELMGAAVIGQCVLYALVGLSGLWLMQGQRSRT
jgi:hypothetical protein